ncbi:MAG TPA: hypothetical protein VML55_24495 [Planctomycetaceae bacterium]|nr:hypothetical protein [Planctomycetaceae bacterium]
MADIPREMMASGRPEDQSFDDEELLYRRFAPDLLDGDEIAIAAVELPDMSIIREKYGRPQWLLLDEDYADWGVLAFHVRDIPPNRAVWHEGVVAYVLEPRHVPYRNNYPHSEVWAYREGEHICRSANNLHLLEPDFHLRWRECIVLASRVAIHPKRRDPA